MINIKKIQDVDGTLYGFDLIIHYDNGRTTIHLPYYKFQNAIYLADVIDIRITQPVLNKFINSLINREDCELTLCVGNNRRSIIFEKNIIYFDIGDHSSSVVIELSIDYIGDLINCMTIIMDVIFE